NLLIYVNPELQRKLLGLFYYSLNPEGVLILGTSETLGEQSHLFSSLISGLKIYKRSVADLNPQIFDFPSSFTRTHVKHINNPEPARTVPNIQTLADQLLLQQFSPSGVLVNENGD